MTKAATWRTVNICACGRLEQEHRDTGKRGTDNGACPGYTLARVEERPTESELRRRLAAIAELVGPHADVKGEGFHAVACGVLRIARGEDS